MKNKNAVYIVVPERLFNQLLTDPFDGLSTEDVIYLQTSLLLNNIENVRKSASEKDIFCVLNVEDEKYIASELPERDIDIKYLEYKNFIELFSSNINLQFNNYQNNLVILSNMMGISPAQVKKTLELINIEDESIILGKSAQGLICLLGFNTFSDEIKNALISSNQICADFLSFIKTENYFINTINSFLKITDLEDFKELYKNLSSKKSYDYCSQEMHERFTHLFIEYKDLLK